MKNVSEVKKMIKDSFGDVIFVEEAANLLSLSNSTLYSICNNLPNNTKKESGYWRISVDELLDFYLLNDD
ncbi:hypothetical protein [uncultured Cetobacterium sp.]|uniref:hypothetical protein n=1 Tax=uncultured Cetobacterium sp. TaxID=527638 RepID=UPI0025CE20D0|nr:hypothetical protein [uncultured Cetobacterium sp.]